MEIATDALLALPRFAVAMLWLWLGLWVFARSQSVDLRALVVRDANPAAAAWLAGHVIGLGLAMRGALYGAVEVVDAVLAIAVSGTLAALLLPLCARVVDWLVLTRFDAGVEVERDRNLGTGLVLGASAIATGMAIDGALTGHSDSIVLGLRDVVVYVAAAQVEMILGAAIYSKIAPFDVHGLLGDQDSTAAGLALAGLLLAIGIVVRASVAGAGSDLGATLAVVAVDGLLGLLVLLGFAGTVARLILRSAPGPLIGAQHNVAAGAVTGAAAIAAALVLAGALRPL